MIHYRSLLRGVAAHPLAPLLLLLALASMVGGCSVTPIPEPPPQDGTARVRIDAEVLKHEINPLLFGMHIEWVDNGNGLLDSERPKLRSEVVELLQPLDIPLFRFPGGIHADYYNWRDGFGRPRSRKEGVNAFTGKAEKHRFGTPEFAALLQATGAEALITANYGTGSAAMAGGWARGLAKARIEARYWEVGNEIYLADPNADAPNGRAIYHPPERYAKDYPAFRRAIRKALPGAQVGALAHFDTGAFPLAPEGNRDWSERMLRALKTKVDFLAVHNGYAPVIIDDGFDLDNPRQRSAVYRATFAAAEQVRENLREIEAKVAQLSPQNRGVPIAITEHGPLFGLSGRPGRHAAYVDHSRTLAAALYVASFFDVIFAEPSVFMTCYTNPIHRWYGSLLTDTERGLVRTPTYYLYWLYAHRFEHRMVETRVDSPTFSAGQVGLVKARRGVPDLVVSASRSAEGRRLTAILVNRSLDRTLTTSVELEGFEPKALNCQLLSASAATALNGPALTRSTLASGDEIQPRPFACSLASRFEVKLPPASILSLEAKR